MPTLFVIILFYLIRIKCIVSQRIFIQGAGIPAVVNLYEAAIVTYLTSEKKNQNIEITYQSMGFSSVLCKIQQCEGNNLSLLPEYLDFASFDSILGPEDYLATPDVQMYPVLSKAVVLIYNIAGLSQTDNLILTEQLILEIYKKSIVSWSDPRILAENNPFVQAKLKKLKDTTISVCINTDSSGATAIFKGFLQILSASLNQEMFHWPASNSSDQGFIFRDYYGVAAYVALHENSIGYFLLGDAKAFSLPMTSIKKGNFTLQPSLSSLDYATGELGMMFGNNGDPPSHLTATLSNANSVLAWPMVGYTYLILRKDTVNPSSNCERRLELVKFWVWFLSSETASLLIEQFGFSHLPGEAANLIVSRLQSDIKCNGQTVLPPAVTIPIRFGLPQFFQTQLSYWLTGAYKVISPMTEFDFVATNSTSINKFLAGELDVIISRGPPFLAPTVISNANVYFATPFAATGFAFICNVCNETKCTQTIRLTLDVNLISNIMGGKIQFWNETGISALQHVNERIVFFGTKNIIDDLVILHCAFYPLLLQASFDYFIKTVSFVETEDKVWLAVSGTPYSMAFVHFSQDIVENPLFITNIKRLDGSVLFPSIQSIGACAQDTYDPKINKFHVILSENPQCYPLVQCYAILSREKHVAPVCSQESFPVLLANFLKWVLRRDMFLNAFSYKMLFPLFPLNDNVYGHVKRALSQITCNGVSVLDVPANYNYISHWASILAWIIFSVVLSVGIGFGIWVLIKRKHKVVRFSQPEFLLLIIIGAILTTYSLIPLSKDDAGVNYYNLDEELNLNVRESSLDAACRSVPWIYLTGFSLEVTALFAKIWRLKQILGSKVLKKVKVTFRQVFPILISSLIATWVFCGVWNLTTPLQWKRWSTLFNDNGVMIASFGRCYSPDFFIFYTIAFLVQFVALIYGIVLCYQTRNVQEEFVESKWITVILLNLFTAMFLTALLGYFMRDTPGALFAIELINIIMSGFFVMLLIIVPKIQMVYVYKNVTLVLVDAARSGGVRAIQSNTHSAKVQKLSNLTEGRILPSPISRRARNRNFSSETGRGNTCQLGLQTSSALLSVNLRAGNESMPSVSSLISIETNPEPLQKYLISVSKEN